MKRTIKNLAKAFTLGAGLFTAQSCGVDAPKQSQLKARSILVKCGRNKCIAAIRQPELIIGNTKESAKQKDGTYSVLFDDTREGNYDVFVSKDPTLIKEFDNLSADKLKNTLEQESNKLGITADVRACDNEGKCETPLLIDATGENKGGVTCDPTQYKTVQVQCKNSQGNLEKGCKMSFEKPTGDSCAKETCTTSETGACDLSAKKEFDDKGKDKNATKKVIAVSKNKAESGSAPIDFGSKGFGISAVRMTKKK